MPAGRKPKLMKGTGAVSCVDPKTRPHNPGGIYLCERAEYIDHCLGGEGDPVDRSALVLALPKNTATADV